MQNSGEKTNSTESFYQRKLDKILSAELTVENINTYADDAMNQLIGLIDEIKGDSYFKWNLDSNLSPKDREDAMLKEVLGGIDVGEILDYIEAVGGDIHSLDTIIDKSRMNQEKTVYVPTDKLGYSAIVAGSGDFAKKELLPKTKTALFILQNDFGVDLNDPEEFQMSTGIVTDDMMRETSYDVIEVPALERIILSCDETGNRTFVFDAAELDEQGITVDQLKNSTKQQLMELSEKNPKLGANFVYSRNYPARLSAFIGSVTADSDAAEQKRQYLEQFTVAPEGYTTVAGYMAMGDYSYDQIKKAIENSTLKPEQFKYDKNARIFDYYKVEDLDKALSELTSSMAPKGYATTYGYSRMRGISGERVKRMIKKNDVLKPEQFKGRMSGMRDYYKVADLDGVLSESIAKMAPEGCTTITGYSAMNNINYYWILKAIDKNDGTLKPELIKGNKGYYKIEDLNRVMEDYWKKVS